MLRLVLQSTRPAESKHRACVSFVDVGFLNWKALFNHAKDAHHSFAEYRKRIFWEAENMDALPLPHSRKRTMLSNFAFQQTHSITGGGEFGADLATMRQRVACVVCATTEWIENMRPCFIWNESDAAESRNPK